MGLPCFLGRLCYIKNMQPWFRVSLDRLEDLPDAPGVYRFVDCDGRLLYIGKSVHLRTRVRSYLRRDGGHSRQTERLKFEAQAVEVLCTGSELAALLLEGRLIREYLPPFNQAQKRYRQYPFLRLSVQEDYPRLHLTRVLAGDGAEYYGPYSQARFVSWMADLLSASLGLRTCRDFSAIYHGCLLDQLGKCLGPCRTGALVAQYRERVERLRALLRGEDTGSGIIVDFERQMLNAAQREDFEQAARWRDRRQALANFVTHQGHLRERVSLDAVAVYPGAPRSPTSVQLFWIRQGKLTLQQSFAGDLPQERLRAELAHTLAGHYSEGLPPAPLFALPQQDLDEVQMVSGWLYRHRTDDTLLWLAGIEPERAAELLLTLIDQAHRRSS